MNLLKIKRLLIRIYQIALTFTKRQNVFGIGVPVIAI